MAKDFKWYVVWEGRETGVFNSWDECRELVEGFPNAKYKAFKTQEAAVAAFRGNPEEHISIIKRMAQRPEKITVNYEAIPEIDIEGIAVDASCMGNPGIMEYQGVDIKSGATLFRVGPYVGGTNNIGEFLAIVHALALCKKQGWTNTIYSDSKTALSWIRKRQSNTTLKPTAQNAQLLGVLQRANNWIQNNTYPNRLLKWDTEEWGEIPADFGRK